MLIPTVKAKEFEKFGFKKCKGISSDLECYYLCVARGKKMLFVSDVYFEVVAEKLARYERLEEQIVESAEQYIQKGIAMPYAVMPEVTRGVVKTVFEGFGGGEEE